MISGMAEGRVVLQHVLPMICLNIIGKYKWPVILCIFSKAKDFLRWQPL